METKHLDNAYTINLFLLNYEDISSEKVPKAVIHTNVATNHYMNIQARIIKKSTILLGLDLFGLNDKDNELFGYEDLDSRLYRDPLISFEERKKIMNDKHKKVAIIEQNYVNDRTNRKETSAFALNFHEANLPIINNFWFFFEKHEYEAAYKLYKHLTIEFEIENLDLVNA